MFACHHPKENIMNKVMLALATIATLGLSTAAFAQNPSASTTAKDVSQAAEENIKKLPDEKMDQRLPAAVRAPLAEYRRILQRGTQAGKMSEAQVKQLATDAEQNLAALRAAAKGLSNVPAALPFDWIGCLRRCETQYSRCRAELRAGDLFGGFLCSIQASACINVCTLRASLVPSGDSR